MKQILPPTKQAELFCGFQKKLSGTQYRRTQFCLEIECEDGLLLFHTLTGDLLLLERKWDSFEFSDELITHRFMVAEDFDECKFANDCRSFLKLINPGKKNKTSFTILTTTDCNARCFYCYEIGRKKISMSLETAGKVATYIADASKGDPVKLHWFGGEPLYNYPAIDTIISDLNNRGITFSSIITTNGYYLDKMIAEKAKNEWKTERVQITLDGTEHIYNATKSYIEKDQINPYCRVMENIGYALDAGILVNIRLNMDRNNAEDLFALCDDLSERFGGKDHLKVGISFLRAFEGEIHPFASEEEAASCYLALYDKLENLGLSPSGRLERKLKSHKCMADSNHSEVILPDGSIGRCEHFSESEIVGSINDNIQDEELISSWKEIAEPFEECRDCALYPRCLRLKKCDWDKDGCPESVRLVKTALLTRQILREYCEWKHVHSSNAPISRSFVNTVSNPADSASSGASY